MICKFDFFPVSDTEKGRIVEIGEAGAARNGERGLTSEYSRDAAVGAGEIKRSEVVGTDRRKEIGYCQ